MLRSGAVLVSLGALFGIAVVAFALLRTDRAAATHAASGYSNIEAADYVGPDACARCHEDKHEHWASSSHRVMNQLASATAVLGDFDDARLDYGDGQVRFTRGDGVFNMSFYRRGALERRFRITRTIGSRYLQEYVGVQTSGPEPAGHWLYSTETRLPYGYWLRQKRWFHQQYFDSWYGPEYAPNGALAVDPFGPDEAPWATRCAWCHNTYPWKLRAQRASGRSTLGSGTERLVSLTTPSDEATRALARTNRLPIEQLVTVGISCESCHLGGREHATNDEAISFAPRSPGLAPRPGAPSLAGGRANNVLINTVCAQCHSTPSPRFPDGAAVRNSSEALAFAAGSCVSRATCTDCHDPHRKGPGGGAADQKAHLQACTTCHPQLADAKAARAHAGHDPAVASCLDCHMPKIVQGIAHPVRTHRISRPVSRPMIDGGAPNACNLCHLDRSLAWTLRELARGWGRALRPKAGWKRLYGERLERPVGRVWLDSPDANVRVMAAAAYARSPRARAALPWLIDKLDDPIAYYRMWMLFAIEDALGRRVRRGEYDPHAAPGVRAVSAARLRAGMTKPTER